MAEPTETPGCNNPDSGVNTSENGSCKPEVKFCGLSHLSDIEAVNSILPEYVGFVFWPKSKRYVDAESAALLRTALDPGIKTVGVFVDAGMDEIAELYRAGIISVAQLHGSETDEYIADLKAEAGGIPDCRPLEIWKAFEIEDEADILQANASTADLVLLDGGKGEGRTFPWKLVSMIDRPYALAGGLTPDNVGEALQNRSLLRHAPSIVDVSSAIEAKSLEPETDNEDSPITDRIADPEPGSASAPELPHGSSDASRRPRSPHKSPELMRKFAEAVRHP